MSCAYKAAQGRRWRRSNLQPRISKPVPIFEQSNGLAVQIALITIFWGSCHFSKVPVWPGTEAVKTQTCTCAFSLSKYSDSWRKSSDKTEKSSCNCLNCNKRRFVFLKMFWAWWWQDHDQNDWDFCFCLQMLNQLASLCSVGQQESFCHPVSSACWHVETSVYWLLAQSTARRGWWRSCCRK